MAYADRDMRGNRMVTIIIVIVLGTALGYAFVTGLAYNAVKKAAEKMNVFDVAPPPPPPPDQPPPPPPTNQPPPPQSPPLVTPPPIVNVPIQAPPMVSVQTPPPAIVFTPTVAPPAPPAPPPPRVSQAAAARGDPSQWITTDDYPPSALRGNEEGNTTISWVVNAQGRVENCHVTSSSGHSDLDEAACRALSRKARYTPAKDQNGQPIASPPQSRRVVWKIPAE